MPKKASSRRHAQATLFAALGDETRLALLHTLSSGRPHSIADLTHGTGLTRQAVTKHLRVLERVRLLHGTRSGRESLFAFNPKPIEEMQTYLEQVSAQWDATLNRLKTFVETNP
ncbi:MAG: metalloregulator ArsR/SmtB family transcription factor [Acidobacteriota bacterium]|nr:metalloregulator ArsR/SmtB family transcription factor [Acidobacteriota bacterium]